MSEVVQLKTWTAEVHDSVVRVLEEALQEARDGKLQAVTVAGVKPDGSPYSFSSKSSVFSAQVGALEIAKHRLIINNDTRLSDLSPV